MYCTLKGKAYERYAGLGRTAEQIYFITISLFFFFFFETFF